MDRIKARFDGKCVACKAEIAKGSPATWDGPGTLTHEVCPEPMVFIDAQKINAMMQNARKHRKYPVIAFRNPRVDFKIAGSRSRRHGSVTLTGPEGAYYGHLDMQTGAWIQRDGTPELIVDFVRMFAAEPAAVVGQAGRDVNECCFCARELSDARSRFAGYGPTCAENYGLPWGEVALTEPMHAKITMEPQTFQSDGLRCVECVGSEYHETEHQDDCSDFDPSERQLQEMS